MDSKSDRLYKMQQSFYSCDLEAQRMDILDRALRSKKTTRERLTILWRFYENSSKSALSRPCTCPPPHQQRCQTIQFSKKSFQAALTLQERAIEHFSRRDFVEAQTLYNKALTYAPPDSKLLGIIFANRSALLISMGEHEAALESIEFAFRHKYPANGPSRLEERRDRCLRALEGAVAAKVEEEAKPELVFKPQKKMPMFAEGTKLVAKSTGRFDLVAERDFKAGEVVLREPYLFTSISSDIFLRCSVCFRASHTLRPCLKCVSAMFCSEECRAASETGVHRVYCAGMQLPPNLSLYDLEVFLRIEAAIQMVFWYPDRVQLRRELDGWARSVATFFEGDFASDEALKRHLSLLVVLCRGSRPQVWPATPLNYAELLHAVLATNPPLAELLPTEEDCVFVLEVLLGVASFPAFALGDRLDPHGMALRPLTETLLALSERPNARAVHDAERGVSFVVTVEPLKKGQTVRVDTAAANADDMARLYKRGQSLQMRCPMALLQQDLTQIEMLPLRGLKIPHFRPEREMFRALRGNERFAAEAVERYQTILKKHKRKHPCQELAIVQWCLVKCLETLQKEK